MIDAPLCPETGRPMARGVRPMRIAYKGRLATIDMPGWYADGSDESIHTRADMKTSDEALLRLKAEADNLATPQEVRRIRQSLGLTQAEAGRVIGGGVRAFQKYEAGKVLASRALTQLLRVLARHPEEIARLRAEAADTVE